MTPGIYTKIPDSAYFALPYLSKSRLWTFAKSPALYRAEADGLIERDDTEALTFGSALDALIFGGEKAMLDLIEIAPDVDRRTKQGKLDWQAAEIAATVCGRKLVKSSTAAEIRATAAAIKADPIAAQLLAGMRAAQIVVIWDEEIAGQKIRCKAKLDGWSNYEGQSTHWDLKSCADASPRKFAIAAAEYGYWAQNCWYLRGCAALDRAAGREPSARRFLLVAAEKTPEFGDYSAKPGTQGADIIQGNRVEVYEFPPEAVEQTVTPIIDGLLMKFAACQAKNEWPAKHTKREIKDLPIYVNDQ